MPLIAYLDRIFRITFIAVLGAVLVYVAAFTWHWPMMVNAPVMHYVNFLMSHGAKPYSEITDMNMPGAYLLERFGMTVFGAGDAGWRIYDFFLDAVTIIAMMAIARPSDWMAGLFAGGIFALRHTIEGPWFSGEREQEMMVLIVVSCALLFTAVRRRQPVYCLGFGLLAGIAASVKPTLLPFGGVALILLLIALRRQALRSTRYLVWSLIGLVAPALASVAFLAHFHAFSSFLFVLRTVSPLYITLNDPGWRALLKNAVPDEWLLFLPLALIGAVLNRRALTWEHVVLWWAAACGLLSYLVQRKGFWYQRYMFLAFLLLLLAMQFLPRDRMPVNRWPALAGLLYAMIYLFPLYIHKLHDLPAESKLTTSMEADLSSLGVSRLQREVQCFDITFGCLNSLYHLGLVENTSFTGDLLLFPKKPTAAADYYRSMFWQLQAERPASVIVFTNQEFGAANSYDRLARWPKFSTYLAMNYHLTSQRNFPREDRYVGQASLPPESAPGYRIFVRNGFAKGD